MAEFIISVQDYNGSPVFDLNASGENIRAVKIHTARTFSGSKIVYLFETKQDCALEFTIKAARGDVDIEIPEGWNVEVGCLPTNDQDTRLPRVKLHQLGKCNLAGYIASHELVVKFYKEHEAIHFGGSNYDSGYDGP